ncbi:aminotransferase class I/II-fold pyridoxal phosphate-dependent enzyme, partial [Rhodococcus qingshengii]|uniref:aminotransferase class I/II-fold pyridoxal phosphate-dependent enzyme n=1 Tax=Rhodococcus qingshengii TaxID=334542 RepID=UPI0035FC50C3
VRGTAGEISEGIRNLISAGVLAPGDALPPIRALADDLEVHRNTVAGAYRLLVAAGVVETQGRRGSFVRAIPFLEGEGGIALPGSVDLASGNPDPALLPDLRASLDRTTYTPRLYGAAATEPLLDSWARSSIEDQVRRPYSITITNGAVDAVERLLTAHLTRGDAVAIEDPCFLASIGTLKANSFRAVPMDIDTSGITPQGLLRALESGVRAIICTPRAHNPTGVSMSADRAATLGNILAEFPHVLVIEDDHFSAVSSNQYCRLAPMSTTRWALVRSVSKFLGPDLRVAVVASDLDTGIRLSTHLRSGANWVSHLQQRLSAELLSDPTVIDGLANARAVYER